MQPFGPQEPWEVSIGFFVLYSMRRVHLEEVLVNLEFEYFEPAKVNGSIAAACLDMFFTI
jgi:hypothetical protein